MKHTVLILMFSVIVALSCQAQDVSSDEVLIKSIARDGEAEVAVPYTNDLIFSRIAENVSISKVRRDSIFIRLSPVTSGWFIKQKFNYRIIERRILSQDITAKSISGVNAWDSYPSYDQYLAMLEKLKSDYPAICQIDTIGTSINGKLILAIKISDNVSADEDEPEVFYSSTMHGDETAGFILMLRLADYILSNYGTNQNIRQLANELEIWINPLANPDGAYRSGSIITNPVRFNSTGYDLNRNFPDPSQPYGQDNIMQKETVEMVKFLRKHRFVLSANFHSGREVVNYPWDIYQYRSFKFRGSLHADDNWFYEVSRNYADMVHRYSPQGYMNGAEYGFDNGITRGVDWYPVRGGRQDYVTWELQGREITIELDDLRNPPYVTPPVELPLIWEYNYRSLLGYLEGAMYGIKGNITDAATSMPVEARIFIPGHDHDSSHVYSDTIYGAYTRLIENGMYNLKFSAMGYRDTIVSDVAVTDYEKTMLNIAMKREVRNIEFPLLFPNPVTVTLRAILKREMTGKVNIKIYNTSGTLVVNYDDVVSGENNPLYINVSGLAGGMYTIVFRNLTGISDSGKFVIARPVMR
ncbi:MAG TPA: M14 family zinc carboxypeptidase [Bacteroidales bacterium]|nr:M14 family zinc carboxypeptidase [Bacteroidales bacterium]